MGIEDTLVDIKDLLQKQANEEKIKEKKWRFPFGKKVSAGQRKKNFVTILLLNENGTYEFKKYQIEDQTILHNAIPRLASAGHVMFDKKGNPLIILPNWSVEPFSPLDHYEKSLINGSNETGYALLMAKMQKEQVSTKAKMGGAIKWIIGLGLAALVGYALITGGGG
jgi:hypothetical protein